MKPVIPTADSRKGRIYIAGPMTGLPEFNFPAFNAKAAELRAEGWHVENPAEHGAQEGIEWADYLRYDLGFYLKHGADWWTHAHEDLQAKLDALKESA